MRSCFHPLDVEDIVTIPLSRVSREDCLCWFYSGNGVFSIRSAYNLGVTLNSYDSTGPLVGSVIWKRLWNLGVSSKIKIFMWRACHSILSTLVAIKVRKLVSSTLCPSCKSGHETNFHAFLGRPLVLKFWKLSSFYDLCFGTDGFDIDSIFCWVASHFVWFCRNSFVFDSLYACNLCVMFDRYSFG